MGMLIARRRFEAEPEVVEAEPEVVEAEPEVVEAVEPVAPEPTKAELVAEAEALGISVPARATKADIKALIEAARD